MDISKLHELISKLLNKGGTCRLVSWTIPNYIYYACSLIVNEGQWGSMRVNEYKYLGVTITADLRWNKHCQTIRHKASRTLGLIRRTLSPCSTEVKARAYTALVRPQLEYGSEAWNPYTASNINSLEQVQKSAARFAQGDYRQTTSSSALVSALGWDSLHSRRLLAQCVLFYKIHHHLVNMPFPPVVTQASYIGRQDHELKYTVPRATIDPYKYSFYPRAIRTWNHLPRAVVLLLIQHYSGELHFPFSEQCSLLLDPPWYNRIHVVFYLHESTYSLFIVLYVSLVYYTPWHLLMAHNYEFIIPV